MWEFDGWAAVCWCIFVILFVLAMMACWDEVRLLGAAKRLFFCFVLAWGFDCYAPNYFKKAYSAEFLAKTGKAP